MASLYTAMTVVVVVACFKGTVTVVVNLLFLSETYW
jgi:hypothetical protein